MAPKNNDASYELFRELLDSKFENLEQKIDNNHTLQTEISTNILNQATKTNGRVNKLELTVSTLEKRELEHVINCPIAERVKQLETENTGSKSIKKFLVQTIIIAGVIGGIVFGLFEIFN